MVATTMQAPWRSRPRGGSEKSGSSDSCTRSTGGIQGRWPARPTGNRSTRQRTEQRNRMSGRIDLWAWARRDGRATPGHGVYGARVSTARRRAHRAPPGDRRASGDVPARGGGRGRRYRPAAVRRARVSGVPHVWRIRARRGAVSVRGLRARAPATLFVQGTGVVSELRGPADDGARRRPDDAVLPWVRCGSGSSRCRIGSGTRWRGKAPRSLAGSPTVRGSS